MSFKNQIGAALKEARMKKGMTMQELADKIGVKGTNTISRYESGRLNLSADLIEKICDAMGIKPHITLN
ncbi:helix-turn-helix domain-containing protein [Sphingobacterium sp. SYP-B4668]|uniref:helix-turn-helix domain-containing protein n=1 Tax=Sphingobacterium sp. SYP-B4668 TaxID=2996035 RepID=UPI0022DDB2D9|nr:helix-turn-helix transcriptional regulator [Sphingobacterium sp. SYP-B4668]